MTLDATEDKILLFLLRHGPSDAEHISRSLGISQEIVTHFVKRMVEQGFIRNDLVNSELKAEAVYFISDYGKQALDQHRNQFLYYWIKYRQAVLGGCYVVAIALLYWLFQYAGGDNRRKDSGNGLPEDFNTAKWNDGDSSKLKDSLISVRYNIKWRLDSLRKKNASWNEIHSAEHQIAQIDNLFLKKAILGYSYPKSIIRRDSKHVNAFVDITNNQDIIFSKLKRRIKMQESEDDTVVIFPNNVIIYDSLKISLECPGHDFIITPLFSDNQGINTSTGNTWDWMITTETDKDTAKLYLNVTSVLSNNSDSLTYAKIPIAVSLETRGLMRKLWVYFVDHLGEVIIIAFGIPLILIIISKWLDKKTKAEKKINPQEKSGKVHQQEKTQLDVAEKTDINKGIQNPDPIPAVPESRIKILFEFEGVHYLGWARKMNDSNFSPFYHIILNDAVQGTLYHLPDGWLFDNASAKKLGPLIGICIERHHHST